MQPTSALAFSYQDITLFARRPGNRWLSLGVVKLSDPDLQGALSDLRGEAIADSGAGFTTLLILPQDQVLYTDITVSNDATARTEIAEQLEGLTPYSVADLVFDCSSTGTVRKVAAVARDTLREAEGFAVEHGFNPVALSAHVPAGKFDGQPNFGPCAGADALLGGAVLEPETGPFRITKAPLPPAAKPKPPQETAPTFTSQRVNPDTVAERLSQLAKRVPPPPDDTPRLGADLSLPVPPPARNRVGIWLTLGLLAAFLIVGAIALVTSQPGPQAVEDDTAYNLLPETNTPEGGSFTDLALAPLPDELAPEPEPSETDGFEPATLPSEDDVIAQEQEAGAPMPLPTPLQIVEIYAASGVWIGTPEAPEPAPEDVLLSLYQTTLDDPIAHADAVALPKSSDQIEPALPRRYLPPPPPGSTFTVDARGLVAPTAEGIVTPDGVRVIAGAPPLEVLPPPRPPRPTSPDTPSPDASGDPSPEAAQRALLAKIRPTPRPANSADAVERSENNGLTLAELRRPEPTPRPKSLQVQAEEEARLSASVAAAAAQAAQQASLASPGAATGGQRATNLGAIARQGTTPEPPLRVTPQSDSPLAIARSAAPTTRPADADQRVAAIAQRATAQATNTASVAPVAPRTQAPTTSRTLPTGSSVARAATQANAISLRDVSLIGVFGKPSSPKALVRLRNGRTVRVGVGDRVDSGRVTSIAPGRLTYRKGSRDLVLEMPRI